MAACYGRFGRPANPWDAADIEGPEEQAEATGWSDDLVGPPGATTNLLLWKPGTRSVNDLRGQSMRAAQSISPGSAHKLSYRVHETGWYYVEVKLTTKAFGAYTLTLTRK